MNDYREVRAAALGILLIAVYMALVLLSGRVDLTDFGRLLFTYLKGSFILWSFVGLCGLGWMLYRNRPVNGQGPSPFLLIGRWVKGRWERDHLISLVWPPLLFAMLMASFNAFKQMILPAAGFRFDPLFAQMDRALFFGEDPWRITHALFGTPEATSWIDAAYHSWFLPMTIGVAVCAWLPRSTYRLRTQYVLSYIMVWIGMGSILAFLLPAAGPCFYGQFAGPGPEFQALMERLAADQATTGSPLLALRNQAHLLQAHGSTMLSIGGGISAMPSVHNGLAVLFAFAAFRINRTAGWAMTAYAGLIWIGSIHLGWHYAIDGLAAVALTWWVWRLSGRIADRLERPLFEHGRVAAVA